MSRVPAPLRPARAAVLALVAAVQVPAAAADRPVTYPSKPVRLVVPFPPGGGNDTVARAIGQKLTDSLRQQVVVDNRAGAAGIVGAEIAARAAPDGYTLFLGGVGSHAINPGLHRKLPYDPVRDFAPISLIASAPLILVVHPAVPAKSVSDLVRLAQAKPGQLNFASNGKGGSSHLAAEMFRIMARVEMVHIPYKGLGPALTDLLAGQVQVMFSSTVAMLPQVKAGRLRPLAMTGARRSAAMPDVPTVAESGVPGYETASWYGILAPRATPSPIVSRLGEDIRRAVASAEIRDRLSAEGAEPVGSTAAEFAAHIDRELRRWRDVIAKAGPALD